MGVNPLKIYKNVDFLVLLVVLSAFHSIKKPNMVSTTSKSLLACRNTNTFEFTPPATLISRAINQIKSSGQQGRRHAGGRGMRTDPPFWENENWNKTQTLRIKNVHSIYSGELMGKPDMCNMYM
jgi:hypothetical protein